MITLAVPKGRVLQEVAKALSLAGTDPGVLLRDDRSLIRECPDTDRRFLLLKPDDVPTYVEYGIADVGIVGRDVLIERDYDLMVPLDLRIGKCRMCVASVGTETLDQRAARGDSGVLRVATKFPSITRAHFRSRGFQVETVLVQGSVELAPTTGLADVIVDLVQSGETLRQNGLDELETICEVSTLLVANRSNYKSKYRELKGLIASLSPSCG